MSVSPEIAAAQAAYAAKPFFAYVRSYGFSGGFRFDTFEAARDYLRQQIERKGACWSGASSSRNQGANLCSFVRLPDGREMQLEALDLIEMPQGPGCPLPIIRNEAEVAAEKAALDAEYTALVGYGPFEDEPAQSIAEVKALVAGYKAEIAADAAEPHFQQMAAAFPDFDQTTLPAIPTHWLDCSWRNDVCPCFRVSEKEQIFVFIDYENPADREIEQFSRYSLLRFDREAMPIMDSDDWDAILCRIIEEKF